MSAKKFKGQKILAMAVVAMFAFCAFSVCFTDNGSDAVNGSYNDTYNLYVVSGGTFTYTPEFNMNSGKITLEVSGNNSTLSGTASDNVITNPRTLSVGLTNDNATPLTQLTTLKATWIGGSQNQLTQTAQQGLNFTIYKDVQIDSNMTAISVTSGSVTSAKDLATITVTGPQETAEQGGKSTTTSTMVTFYKDDTICADAPFEIVQDGMGAKLKSTRALAPTDAGLYKFDLTASFNATGDVYTDSDTETFYFTVYKTLEISVEPPMKEVYIGQPSVTPEFTFSLVDNTQGATATYDFSEIDFGESGIAGTPSQASSVGKYTVNITSANHDKIFPTNTNAVQDYVDYNIKATATISYPGDDAKDSTDDATGILRVFKSLAFTKKPVVENSQSYAASGNPLDVLISADFTGTSKISYNWGDGKSTTITTNPDSGSKYSARHVYANSGSYLITITAYNSTGSTTMYTLYDADTSFFEEVPAEGDNTDGDNKDDTPAKESVFDKHGYQFIVFTLIAVLAFVAFFFFGIQNPIVLIVAIITALLAVLCFVYNDIGGLIEELKALLKL